MYTDEQKREMYRAKQYAFPPPPVQHTKWGEAEWIRYIDTHGQWTPTEDKYLGWVRGPNTPVDKYPSPPVFTKPANREEAGAWQNLGGHWVKER